MTNYKQTYRSLLFVLTCLLASSNLFATVYTVTTKTDLQTRMNAALPGDTVKVANGSYNNWGQILFTNNNGTSSSAWIVLQAETLGGVIFTGNTYLGFKGTRVMVYGFTFANGSAGTNAVVSFRSSSSNLSNFCRISNIKIDNFNTWSVDSLTENEWVGLYGTNNRVDNCTFINKYNARATVVVWYSSTTYPAPAISTYHRIDSNYFAGRSYLGANGGETIRVGDSNGSRTNGFNTIEYNLFENSRQTEPEIISNKSNFNVYRYNTFKNSNGGLTLRHGRYCLVYGNFFIVNDPTITQAYGIRVIDKGHRVYNNYIEAVNGNSTGGTSQLRAPINLFNGLTTDTTTAADASGYFAADSVIVAFNTIVNAKGGGGIVLGGTTGGTIQPKGVILANNLVKMATGSAIYRNPVNTSLTYSSEGNIYQAPSGLGETVTTGWQATTLTFGTRTDGILPPPSLVMDAAINSALYASLLNNVDVKGRTRSGVFDVGCEELNATGLIVYFPLDSSQVGAGPHGSPLPVRLINFSASQKGEEVQLQWNVANENNLSHYLLEMSGKELAFQEVAMIKAVGASGYLHSVKDLAKGKSYFFRLKMVDNDGKFTYSKVIAIDTRQTSVVKIFPNPATSIVNINLQDDQRTFEIVFINSNGKIVKKINSATGNNTIDVMDMSNGFYYIHAIRNNETFFRKPIMIQHK